MINMQIVRGYKLEVEDLMDDIDDRMDAIELLTNMLVEDRDIMVRVDLLKTIIDDVVAGTRACLNSAILLGAELKDSTTETD